MAFGQKKITVIRPTTTA